MKTKYKLPEKFGRSIEIIFQLIGAIVVLILIGHTLKECIKEIYEPRFTIVIDKSRHTARRSNENVEEDRNRERSKYKDDRGNGGAIEERIREVFGEEGDKAVELARCESGLDPLKPGDQNLAFNYKGETLGTSHGLFQIRTGGKEKNGLIWSRPEKLGMTVDEFVKKMEDPEENIKYAKKVFDRSGWYAWYNCAVKIGII